MAKRTYKKKPRAKAVSKRTQKAKESARHLKNGKRYVQHYISLQGESDGSEE